MKVKRSLEKKDINFTVGLLRWFSGEESTCQAGDTGLILGLARSPGERNGSPLQYSCLGHPTDWGACGPQSTESQRVCLKNSSSSSQWVRCVVSWEERWEDVSLPKAWAVTQWRRWHSSSDCSGCYCSVPKSSPTLCHPVDCSKPDSPSPHCLLEFGHIRVRVCESTNEYSMSQDWNRKNVAAEL